VAVAALLDTCVLYPAYLLRLPPPPRRVRGIPSTVVTGYESLVEGMTNEPKDRHVLAAAVRASAEAIVTFNERDFPEQALKPYDVVAIHPDDFLLDQLDQYPILTIEVLQRQAAAYRREPTTVGRLLPLLQRSGLPRFTAAVGRRLT
jgi:hypothetical protein